MIDYYKIKKDFRLYKIIAIAVSIAFLIFFPSAQNYINKMTEKTFLQSVGRKDIDTNIVILRIDETTINTLQGWPIKRSFYALALNYLRKLKVNKIGLEVFLGNQNSALSIYNNPMIEELKKNQNIILSGILPNVKYQNGKYFSDSLLRPSLNNEKLKVKIGHINYLEEDGFFIPQKVYVNNELILSFSSLLAGRKINSNFLRIKINHSWRDYISVELVEFLKSFEQDESKFKNFKGKLILIGVTDELISKNIKGVFDSRIPGVGFHAIAIDNILHSDFLLTKYKNILALFFLLILIISIFYNIHSRELINDIFISFGLLFLIFILYTFADYYINFSFVVLPVVFNLAVSFAHNLKKNRTLINETISENKILNEILRSKETELQKIAIEFSKVKSEKQEELNQKMDKLKSEIDSLRKAGETQKDESEAVEIGVPNNFEGIIYVSNEMEKVVRLIKKVAPQDVSVLILGQSGTGKELVANAIHKLSKRNKEKFIAVNCAALTETLLESELFGHVKGAFTNAISDKKGIFEAANNGTIFLDEIGETSENFQVKLLRVLQSGEIQKVGSTETIFVNVRVIAATNKKLDELVKQKKFREDLYYRLNVIQIDIPELRERKEDIQHLANYFASKENENLKISKFVVEQLEKYEWKGNVRELQSVIKRSAIFALSDNREIIKLTDLPENISNIKKIDLENLIIDSLREKKFSHSSINETAAELGNINRGIVSEHLRGMFFKALVNYQFNFNSAVRYLSGSQDESVTTKLSSKCETYLSNIEKEVIKYRDKEFEEIKVILSSKYRNLPSKYHEFLDEVIRYLLSVKNYETSGI